MKALFISVTICSVLTAGLLQSCSRKPQTITGPEAVKVKVQPVTANGLSSVRTYSGTVATGEGAEVSFTIPGTVKEIYVKEGQTVRKGDLMAELKADNLINADNIAQAALNEAQDAYNRFKQLHDANALADIKWVEVQNALKTAQNSAEVARRAIGDAKVYAPVSGTVSEKLVDPGQTVVPALPVFRIVTLSDVKVSIPVPEGEIAAMNQGSKADVVIDALGGASVVGTLTEKGVSANPLTRAYEVKFSVPNPGGKLLPGMTCTVTLRSDAASAGATMVLPTQSVLLSADNRQFVWLAKGGKATRRYVVQGGLAPDGIIITSGVEPGDSVIVAGMQKVSEGTDVIPQI